MFNLLNCHCVSGITNPRRHVTMSAEFYFSGDCNDPDTQMQIKEKYIEAIQNSNSFIVKKICQEPECNIGNVKVFHLQIFYLFFYIILINMIKKIFHNISELSISVRSKYSQTPGSSIIKTVRYFPLSKYHVGKLCSSKYDMPSCNMLKE